MRLQEFFAFARERHRIAVKRGRAEPFPWTDDPILREYRFTNVFRELDATTVWFRQNIREPLRDDPRVLLATIAFRWFNKIETGRVLQWGRGPMNTNLFLEWSTVYANRRLRDSGPPWITGAYIIKTPNGMDKLDGVLWCIEQCANDIERLYRDMAGISLEAAWKFLCQMPYMGPFMAYEVITDLRHTHMLESALDKNTWANPGPGCRRGLSRLVGKDKDHFRSGKNKEILDLMHEILKASFRKDNWPCTDDPTLGHFNCSGKYKMLPNLWPAWEMREVEHTLCEWDKYERARLGEGRPKQKFSPT